MAEKPVVAPACNRKGVRQVITRPSHIVPSQLDIRDHSFPAQCLAWTDQMRLEMKQTIALTKEAIAESRACMVETDRMLARG